MDQLNTPFQEEHSQETAAETIWLKEEAMDQSFTEPNDLHAIGLPVKSEMEPLNEAETERASSRQQTDARSVADHYTDIKLVCDQSIKNENLEEDDNQDPVARSSIAHDNEMLSSCNPVKVEPSLEEEYQQGEEGRLVDPDVEMRSSSNVQVIKSEPLTEEEAERDQHASEASQNRLETDLRPIDQDMKVEPCLEKDGLTDVGLRNSSDIEMSASASCDKDIKTEPCFNEEDHSRDQQWTDQGSDQGNDQLLNAAGSGASVTPISALEDFLVGTELPATQEPSDGPESEIYNFTIQETILVATVGAKESSQLEAELPTEQEPSDTEPESEISRLTRQGASVELTADESVEPEDGVISGVVKEGKFQCPECPYGSKFKSNLKAHVMSVHRKVKSYQCSGCDYKAEQKCYIARHIKKVHSKAFSCSECEHVAISKSQLNKHIKTEHSTSADSPSKNSQGEQGSFPCPICDHVSPSSKHLSRHLKSSHRGTQTQDLFSCPECDLRSAHKHDINRHIKAVHFLEKEYKCRLCDFSTAYQSSLCSHVRAIHNNVKTFACHLCDYRASGGNRLRLHIKGIHLKQRDLKCPECDYTTTQTCNLKTHTRTVHGKVKSFSCPECDFKTAYKHVVDRHIGKKHWKVTEFSCEQCSFKSDRKYRIAEHTEKIHNNGKK